MKFSTNKDRSEMKNNSTITEKMFKKSCSALHGIDENRCLGDKFLFLNGVCPRARRTPHET